MPQYYVEGSHEPIIPRDIYMRVQEEMLRRVNLHSGQERKKRVYSSKYALSSIVYCSKCGEIYRRIQWNAHGKRYVVWRCCTRVENGPDACDADTIKEEELQKELLKVANSKGNYDSITDEIYRLREMKQNAMADSAEREGLKLRIDEMRQFLDEQTESITEYDEKLTRRLIEKITVYEDHFTIEVKSGTNMDVHR